MANAAQEDHGLVYAGSAFVTLGRAERDAFWRAAEVLATAKPALPELRSNRASWCRPEMVVRVRHLKGGDMLRHGSVQAIV